MVDTLLELVAKQLQVSRRLLHRTLLILVRALLCQLHIDFPHSRIKHALHNRACQVVKAQH